MKFIIMVLFFIPTIVFSQNPSVWTAQVHNKPLEWKKIDDTLVLTVGNNGKTDVTLSHNNPEKIIQSNVSIICMDASRKELARVHLSENKAILNTGAMFHQIKDATIYIYSISIPKDPAIAMRVRIGTVFIGKLIKDGIWK